MKNCKNCFYGTQCIGGWLCEKDKYLENHIAQLFMTPVDKCKFFKKRKKEKQK